MMVTPTFIAELEAAQVALTAERSRIREEYETCLPDIESSLASIEQILRYGRGQTGVELAVDAPEAVQPVQNAPEVAQDTPDATVAVVAATDPMEAAASMATPVGVARATPARPNWRRELAGLRQEPAAVRIAERAGGTVTVSDVALVFMEVGLTRATGKLAKGQASKTLSESPRFDRIGRGIYRLVAEPVADLQRCSARSTATSEAQAGRLLSRQPDAEPRVPVGGQAAGASEIRGGP